MDRTTKRNIIGMTGWFVLTLLCTAVITLPAMALRELWQARNYGFCVEEDDLWRYGITIVVAQVVQVVMIMVMV